MQPLVSVVIPTFNREGIIGRAVQSVLEQTYPNVEIIVVDDGSRDGTLRELRRFGDRIQVYQQENSGPSVARNRGIARSRGEIIAFLDSDDTWMPAKLARQVSLLEKLGKSVSCCLCNVLLPHKPYGCETSFAVSDLHPTTEEGQWRNPTEVLLTRFVLFNQAVAVRREVLNKAGLFNSDLRLLEDYELALRLSVLGPFAFVRTPLVSYGTGEANSLSASVGADKTKVPRIAIGILEDLGRRGEFQEPQVQRLLRRRIRVLALQLFAAEALRKGPIKRSVGRVLALGLRLREAAVRRSPFLPRMDVVCT